MKKAINTLLTVALLATALTSRSGGAATPTIINRNQVGPVKSRMVHADLEKLTGSSDIADNTVKLGGDTRPCTDLWSSQADRHIRVLFDSNNKVEQALLIGQSSLYKTSEGITLGTTLRELEKLNGKPFKLSGFGWEFGGRINDWREGKLARLKGISLGLEFEPLRWTRLPDQGASISGERPLISSDPELHRLNPYVSRIEVDLSAR